MKKRILIFVVLILMLIAIGILFTRHMNSDLEPPVSVSSSADNATPEVATENPAEHISVLNVNGVAEKKSSADGRWSPMTEGDRLNVDDSVRTRNESSVILGLGEASTIELNNASEIEVRELSGAIQRLGLIRGRASVDYGENGERVLNIENSDGTVVAKVDDGKFSILNNGQVVVVATETGSVDLSAEGQSVKVTGGMESVVEKGRAPVTPYAISTEAYLKLSTGACRKQSDTLAIVRGTISAGTEVFVNDSHVEPNEDGSFMARVWLAANTRKVHLKTVDIWGSTREQTLTCLEPRNTASIKKVVIDWGKKGE